eukprot:3887206-Amphidinium_carterae.1
MALGWQVWQCFLSSGPLCHVTELESQLFSLTVDAAFHVPAKCAHDRFGTIAVALYAQFMVRVPRNGFRNGQDVTEEYNQRQNGMVL